MIEDYIDAIVEIGNHKKVIKVCEPNIMQPLQLKTWMVVRTLYSLGLLLDEVGKDDKAI